MSSKICPGCNMRIKKAHSWDEDAYGDPTSNKVISLIGRLDWNEFHQIDEDLHVDDTVGLVYPFCERCYRSINKVVIKELGGEL